MPFFPDELTLRQLLTSRIMLGVVPLAAVGLAASFWAGQQAATRPATAMQALETQGPQIAAGDLAAPVAEPGDARLLTVSVSQLGLAGPDFLAQRFTGIVTARRSSQLAAKAVGRVEEVKVEVGDHVQRGQLLVQLDIRQLSAARELARASLNAAKSQLDELQRGPRHQDIEQAEARVEELQANLNLSRANFARLERLRSSDAISQQEFDEQRYAVNAIEAQLEAAKQALDLMQEGTRREQLEAQQAVVQGLQAQIARTEADMADQTITAPFSGTIQSRLVDEGAVVSPGQSLLQILEEAPYEVRVGLPAEAIADLAESNVSVIQAEKKLGARISRVAPAIQGATRTREVVLLLSDTASREVSVGSAVTVVVERPTQSQGFWVPSNSLTAGPRGLWAVFVAVPVGSVSDSRASCRVERRQVELLRAYDGWAEISGPLSAEDQLITEGVHRITPGQLVQCRQVDSAAAQFAVP